MSTSSRSLNWLDRPTWRLLCGRTFTRTLNFSRRGRLRLGDHQYPGQCGTPEAGQSWTLADMAGLSFGAGSNRIEIHALRGEASERQMMVYCPERKSIYGSDAFQKSDDGWAFPQTVSELVHAPHEHRIANGY
jgi:hypothetical protein